MTKPISVRLEESVIQLLKERAREAGVSQADYLTGLITCAPVIEHVADAPVSSFGDPAREARKVQKRKAALAQSVASALPTSSSLKSGGIKQALKSAVPALAAKLATQTAALVADVMDVQEMMLPGRIGYPTREAEKDAERPHRCSGALPIEGCAGCQVEVEILAKAMKK